MRLDARSTRPPRTTTPSTPATTALHLHYLHALAKLAPHHAHELRGRLGGVALHLDLASELLAAPGADTGRVRDEIGRARAGLGAISGAFESMLGLGRADGAAVLGCDVRDLVRDLEIALRGMARERRVSWRIALPERPVTTGTDRETLRQALLVTAVAVLERVPDGGQIAVSLEHAVGEAAIAIAGASAAGAPVSTRELLETLELVGAACASSACQALADDGARIRLMLSAEPSAE